MTFHQWPDEEAMRIWGRDAEVAVLAALQDIEGYLRDIARLTRSEAVRGNVSGALSALSRFYDVFEARSYVEGLEAKAGAEVSTTHRTAVSGTVHEMADRGVGTMCGRQLPEPWNWTEDPVTCRQCLKRIEQEHLAALPVADLMVDFS